MRTWGHQGRRTVPPVRRTGCMRAHASEPACMQACVPACMRARLELLHSPRPWRALHVGDGVAAVGLVHVGKEVWVVVRDARVNHAHLR